MGRYVISKHGKIFTVESWQVSIWVSIVIGYLKFFIIKCGGKSEPMKFCTCIFVMFTKIVIKNCPNEKVSVIFSTTVQT